MADESEGRSVIGGDSAMDHSTASNQRVRVIQKEQDSITAFCINKVTNGLMSVATPREILEVNMGLLLHPNAWSDRMDDEAEFDILYMQEENQTPIKHSASPAPPSSDSHLHTAWSTTGSQSGMASLVSSPMSSQAPPFGTTGSQPRSSHVVKRHKMDGVRRLAAHSHLPLYVSGGQDGAVAIWEWTHSQPITTVRPPGIYAKVNRIVFSPQGNKFGVCDGDGNLALWQAANTSHPYFNLQCHSKNTADFIFQGGSSSLLATAGHSHDNKNIALWDTLMPSKRSCTQGFTCHEAGAACLVHATQHQLIISAGKKGQVCIWDLRQNKLIYSFKAHDHAVKCLAIDEHETMFVTGAVDGTVKVWDLSHHKTLHTFTGEHARQGLFKNISQGVAQVHLDNNMLFSCGADGSCKVRQLPERDLIVNSVY
jgi:WD40 repeat protein